jgi:Bifunctional DNA primase/polymerase, N-terminal
MVFQPGVEIATDNHVTDISAGNVVLEAALIYAGLGWRVFPVMPRDKTPLVPWQDQATADLDQVRWWWGYWRRRANVGVICPPGIVVIDVDPRHAGDRTLAALEAEHGALPPTLECRTGGGGSHLWFSAPDPDQLRQGSEVLGPGLDTRCAGRGFLMMPFSVNESGRRYTWAEGTAGIAPAPSWAVEMLRKPVYEAQPAPPPTSFGRGASVYGARALTGEVNRLRGAKPGYRNEGLHRAAVRLGQLVVAGHLQAPTVVNTLMGAGLHLGLDAREVEGTFASGLCFGMGHPR